MKIVISIFCLPYEIDELENTLNQLKKASYYIDKSLDWNLDVTMCTSSEMVNWDKSSINKKYFEDKFLKLASNTDWCVKNFQTSEKILGCVSQRRFSFEKHRDADYFIWLDTDIIFDERTLTYIDNIANQLKHPSPIITPEIVKVWDNSWDCLVNEKFLNEPTDYQKNNNPFVDCGIKGDISVETVVCNWPNHPTMKFAGGWFTCIHKSILDKITVPESFGHYGMEDTFLMWACEKLKFGQQYKIKNLVICENYKFRFNQHITNRLASISRKDEFLKIAQSNFPIELEKLV